jgi:6-pyruvoyltetrahydropterin/6-carboxytetrahydropterin synthase
MTVLAGRRESFNAAHQLRDPALSDEQNRRLFGKCANLHGHNYVLEVVVADDIDQATGYLLDLKLPSDIITRQVIRDVDHRNLNADVPWLKGRVPSTETWPGHSGNGSGRSCGGGTRLRTWECLTISITD